MRQRTVSGEIDTQGTIEVVDAVRLLPRDDDTTQVRPRAWPRATRELTLELPIRSETEKLRTTIWCAVGGLLVVAGLYLVF